MPTLGGDEAARRIREREAGEPGAPRTPILALTAYALPEDRARFLSLGIDDCVTKPVDVNELFATMAQVTSNLRKTANAKAPRASAAQAEVPAASGFDQTAVARRFAGRFDFWAELAGEFLERSFPSHTAGMRSGMERGDLNAAGKSAHTLKGVCGTVCAPLAEELAAQAVIAIRGNDTAGLSALLTLLEQEKPRLAASLAAAVGKSGSGGD